MCKTSAERIISVNPYIEFLLSITHLGAIKLHNKTNTIKTARKLDTSNNSNQHIRFNSNNKLLLIFSTNNLVLKFIDNINLLVSLCPFPRERYLNSVLKEAC